MEEKDVQKGTPEETAGTLEPEETAQSETPETDTVQEPETKEEQTPPENEAAESKDPAPTGEEKAEDKKSFFKKKKDKKDAQIEELTDRVRRQMAEFDNFRKRTEKEKSTMYDMGVRDTVEKILPVVDNFERGLKTAEADEDPFIQGMQKIYKQLMDTLEAMEVKPIEAVGKPFDPDFHNAVMHVDDEEAGENIIVEEFQKGYIYRGTVIRHSMVKVAN